jgi:hypothetical protein
MNEMIKTGITGNMVPTSANHADDPFQRLFEPARAALIAARKLKTLASLSTARMLNIQNAEQHREIALERFEMIPEDAVMYGARRQFEAAETEPAPEPWLHAAIGLMLDSIPGAEAVSPAYRFGLIDSITNDDDSPGFSCAVIVMAIREMRRTIEGVPSPATFLKACTKHRGNFSKLVSFTERLIEIRQNAEDILEATGDLKFEYDDDEDVPF